MTTKHTPGPWTTIKHDTLRDTYEIADKVGYERKTVAVGVNAANARLIAAAPDMLEALTDAGNVLAGLVTGQLKSIQKDSPVLNKIRAAIARATGE